jgi:hypothetical protein
MYVCVYVCMYVYIYIYVYMYVFFKIYIYLFCQDGWRWEPACGKRVQYASEHHWKKWKLKKDLKNDILEWVSTPRKVFSKMKARLLTKSGENKKLSEVVMKVKEEIVRMYVPRMYGCMCVCMYVCVCVCVYIYICVCVCVIVYIHIYIYIY